MSGSESRAGLIAVSFLAKEVMKWSSPQPLPSPSAVSFQIPWQAERRYGTTYRLQICTHPLCKYCKGFSPSSTQDRPCQILTNDKGMQEVCIFTSVLYEGNIHYEV